MCSVDKTGCEAIITQRALVFLSAVASRFRSCGGSVENFVVMLLNDAFHVIHTAVANFNCVFVENFVVPMVFRLNLRRIERLKHFLFTFPLSPPICLCATIYTSNGCNFIAFGNFT